jgi:hypothetical protein
MARTAFGLVLTMAGVSWPPQTVGEPPGRPPGAPVRGGESTVDDERAFMYRADIEKARRHSSVPLRTGTPRLEVDTLSTRTGGEFVEGGPHALCPAWRRMATRRAAFR